MSIYKMPIWRRATYIFGTMLVVGMLLYTAILPRAEDFLITRDTLQQADAVIPLSGNVLRLRHAKMLFTEDYADRVVVTTHHAQQQALAMNITPQHLLLVPEAQFVRSTYDEARAVRVLAQEHGFQSLTIVTSPTHTRRAQYIFRDVFQDSAIVLRIIPAQGDRYPPEQWWQDRFWRLHVSREYVKFAFYLAGGYHFLPNANRWQ